jgi:phage terminase small subunit
VGVALTAKQEKFVREYLANPNATQAAVRAGYSPKTAYSIGPRLLKHVEVKAAIEEAIAQEAITPERVINELARIATGDLRDVAVWDKDGVGFIPSADLTPDAAATIKKVKSIHTKGEDGVERTTFEVEQYDRTRALELLGRRFKLFTDRVEMDSGEEGFTIKFKGLPDKPHG